MADILTVPLEGRVPGGANIEILRAELRADMRSFLALIRYSEQGQEPKYGIRLDLDKKVFIDHLVDEQQERVMQRAAPELAAVLNEVRREAYYRQYKSSAQTAVSHIEVRDEQTLSVIEESLEVGKRQVQRGGVRIYSHVAEKPVEASVNLREEHVTVERHAVNRPANEADSTAFREGTIEVTETAEVPVVAKEASIVEEVTVGKAATERVETVHDTACRTDVEVEQIAGQTIMTGTAYNTNR